MTDLIARVEELKEMGAGLKCLKESINTSSSAGHLVRGPAFERLPAAAGRGGILEVDSSEDSLSGLFNPNGNSLEAGRFPVPPGSGPRYVPDLQVASDMPRSKTNIDVPND